MRLTDTVWVMTAVVACVPAAVGEDFRHWESPHVHPLAMTPDGARLLAVNTPDHRLELFDLTSGAPVWTASVPVGLEPVSVRARTDTEAWVVNHVSDTVSIVDLTALTVIDTIGTDDEPCDVVFAGVPERAFISVSQRNHVEVYDPADLDAAPVIVPIEGEDPRALATDGARVFVAIMESGNQTTIIDRDTVSSAVNPYPGDPNPVPNAGLGFDPPLDAGLPTPPRTALIVRRDALGDWVDDNGGVWTPAVTWGVLDNDLAMIDAGTLAVSYITGLMNANMAVAVRADGHVTVVGTDARNEIRFEPNLAGRFLRVLVADVDPAVPGAAVVRDLNPHLDYAVSTIPQAQRELSIGDPRQVAWNAAGTVGYVAGMGSGTIAVIDAAGVVTGRLAAGGMGPTGLVVDEPRGRLYVLNKFDSAVSAIALGSGMVVSGAGFFEPMPPMVAAGRRHLYDTHATSGLGHTSCASCHVDARMDQMSWDLGTPAGQVETLDEPCVFGCSDWHPMKGPLATQTLVGIFGTEPLHWRGDREDLAAFNPAFVSLLGDDETLTETEMQEFEAFVLSISTPPNPNRNFDGSTPASFLGGGSPASGEQLFSTSFLVNGIFSCFACHAPPAGSSGVLMGSGIVDHQQAMKVPQLRNIYEKVGFDRASPASRKGFGFTHDASVDTLANVFTASRFTFAAGAAGDQQRLDVEAFLMCYPTDTHAAVGTQLTLAGPPSLAERALIDAMLVLRDQLTAGVVVRGIVGGEGRGYAALGGGMFQSDRATEQIGATALRDLAGPDQILTWTVVPLGTAVRIGIDRDRDGFPDRDELDAGTDPSDPADDPGCPGDSNLDGATDSADLSIVVGAFGSAVSPGSGGDVNGDGMVDAADLSVLISAFGCTGPAPL